MPTIGLGPVGAILSTPSDTLTDDATRLADLGYPTVLVTGGGLTGLDQVADVVRGTRGARILPAILAEDRFGAAEVNALYRQLEAEQPGRFVVGVGGARSARPLQTLREHLAALDAVPQGARLLSALGPRMLGLARDAAAGALPVLVTPEYTAGARDVLGSDSTLAVMQFAVLDADRARARDVARPTVGFFTGLPAYRAAFARMGFGEDDLAQVSDWLVDGVIACGDADAVLGRVADHHTAGADHVAVGLLTAGPGPAPVEGYRRLAADLGL